MSASGPTRLQPPFSPRHDHAFGSPEAGVVLLEFGSYTCPYCHAAHSVIGNLQDRFGERMRYAFRHLPITGNGAEEAAALAEYAATQDKFWPVHNALMTRGPRFGPGELAEIAAENGIDLERDVLGETAEKWRAAVAEDIHSARRSGAAVTPTFFINDRRYEGPWDEASLTEAMLGSVGERLRAARLAFLRWAPSAGLLLLVMSVLAIVFANTASGPAIAAFWHQTLALMLGDATYGLSLLDWVNHGLLTLFFLVVGLEIKRELSVGRLSNPRAAALPIVAALGGMIVPAALYLAVVGFGPLGHGWAVPISTDTAFAIALIAVLGARVPVELRIFLAAAVIVDDLVAISILALFYSGPLDFVYLAAAAGIILALVALNRSGVYRALPYAVLGIALWICMHQSGLHATLTGVILAAVTPTRPPANLKALLAQAEALIVAEYDANAEAVSRSGPSTKTLEALDIVHERIESPASKLLRSVEPWSSYAVLPLFALANAGVVLSLGLITEHSQLFLAIVLGLVVGKPLGIVAFAWIAVRTGIAAKPDAYSWRQLIGAGTLAGIGFTISLFIAEHAFGEVDFAAAKIAIVAASLLAAALGVAILWPRPAEASGHSGD